MATGGNLRAFLAFAPYLACPPPAEPFAAAVIEFTRRAQASKEPHMITLSPFMRLRNSHQQHPPSLRPVAAVGEP